MPEPLNPVHASLTGIALGDSLGMPADVHRTTRSPWVRSRLWEASAELDEQRVARPLQPFHSGLDAPRLVATDDTETAAFALHAFLAAGGEPDRAVLFDYWQSLATGEEVWGGVAERAAARNAAVGLRPPHTGHDHPADTSDSAVPAGIALGAAFEGSPAAAVEFARAWAEITHSRDGLDAAVFSAALTAAVKSEGFDDAISSASHHVDPESWLAARLALALSYSIKTPAQLLSQLPGLLETFSPRSYSAGGIAPETLPLALIILRATATQPELAIPLSLTFARHSDSLPPIVGGLASVVHGPLSDHDSWARELDQLGGYLYPALAGVSLTQLSRRVAEVRSAVR